jgi:hypothetical protein
LTGRLRLKNNLFAVSRRDHDIMSMKRLTILMCVMALALGAGEIASAQFLPPGASQFNPPPPAPPPPPKIEVPTVPQLDALPSPPSVEASPRGSFSDRISRCLDEGAAAGLGPNARAAYSRSCANQ